MPPSLFNFHYITDPPNDEFVDEEYYLNYNFKQLENKLSWIQGRATNPDFPANTPPGVEGLLSGRFAVFNGSAQWVLPTDIGTAWSAWTTISPASPFVVRTGWPLKYRTNSALRKVQMTGSLINTVSATAWPKSVWNMVINAGIPASFAPLNSLHMQCGGTSTVPSGTAGIEVSSSRIRVTPNGANPVRIECHWMGQDGGGNWLGFDGIEWYY